MPNPDALDRRRAALVITLAVVAAVPALRVKLGGVHVTLERLAMVVTLPAAVALVGGPARLLRRLGWPHAAFAVFIACNLAFSVLGGGDSVVAIRNSLLLALVSVPFFVLPVLLVEDRLAGLAYRAFLAAAAIEAVAGLVALLAARLAHRALLGAVIDPLTGGFDVRILQWEPNTFSSFVGAGAVMLLPLVLDREAARTTRRVALLGEAALMGAVLLNLSRGAWLGTLAGALVALGVLRGRRAVAAAVLATLVLVGALLAAGPSAPLVGSTAARIASLPGALTGHADATTITRQNAVSSALAEWQRHPLVGTGPGATESVPDGVPGVRAYVPNIFIRALRDTGVIGAVALAVAFLGPGLVLWRRGAAGPSARLLVPGVLGAVVLVAVAFQVTDATWLSYPWYLLGLAWALAQPPATAT